MQPSKNRDSRSACSNCCSFSQYLLLSTLTSCYYQRINYPLTGDADFLYNCAGFCMPSQYYDICRIVMHTNCASSLPMPSSHAKALAGTAMYRRKWTRRSWLGILASLLLLTQRAGCVPIIGVFSDLRMHWRCIWTCIANAVTVQVYR